MRALRLCFYGVMASVCVTPDAPADTMVVGTASGEVVGRDEFDLATPTAVGTINFGFPVGEIETGVERELAIGLNATGVIGANLRVVDDLATVLPNGAFGTGAGVLSIAVRPDGNIAFGTADGAIYMQSRTNMLTQAPGYTGSWNGQPIFSSALTAMDAFANGDLLIGSGIGYLQPTGQIYVRDKNDVSLVSPLLGAPGESALNFGVPVNAIAVSPSGNMIIGLNNGQIVARDPAAPSVDVSSANFGAGEPINAIDVFPDGRVVIGRGNGRVDIRHETNLGAASSTFVVLGASVDTVAVTSQGNVWMGTASHLVFARAGTNLNIQTGGTDGLDFGAPVTSIAAVPDTVEPAGFSIESIARGGNPGTVVLAWTGEAGREYTVEKSTDGLAGFSAVAFGLPTTEPLNVYTATVQNAAHAAYRVQTDPTPVISVWDSPAQRATLQAGTIRARLQAGIPYELSNPATGRKLADLAPDALDSVVPIFGVTSVNLDQATVSQVIRSESTDTTYTWPDGTAWHITWSLDGDDLVLAVSAQTPQPVELFSYFISGLDLVGHSVVGVDVNGVAQESGGPFSGPLFANAGSSKTSAPQTFVQPLLALFEGPGEGFVFDGRDPEIGPSNLRPFGSSTTGELMLSRTLEHLPTRSPAMYELRIRSYQGDWRDGVDPHIAWMEDGLGFLPFDRKPQTWVQDIRNQAYLNVGDYAMLNGFAARFIPTKTYIGRQAEYRNHAFDVGYPDYTVATTARPWIAQARALGFHFGVHVNVGGIDRGNTALIQQMAPALLQIGTDGMGNPVYDGTATFVYASAAYAPWRQHLINAVADVVAAGADVIYLDQTNGVLGKFFVNGMTGIAGVMLLMQEMQAAYPGVAFQTEQLNPMSSRHAAFALTTLPLGHPLSGYLFGRFIKIVPEGINYQPVDVPTLDAFTRWGHFTPGAGGSEPQESWLQIAEVFQQYDLVPNARLPLGPNQVSGFEGPAAAGFFEQTATTRSFVVYEPGQPPLVAGLRYTGVTEVTGPPGGIKDWLIYDAATIMGLDPAITYFFDPAIVMDSARFHLAGIPVDYQGYADANRLIVPHELGFFDRWLRVTFTGNGQVAMTVPDNYDVYLDGQAITIDRVNDTATATVAAPAGSPSEILAFLNSGPESGILEGYLTDLPWHLAKHKAPKALFDQASSLFPPHGFFNIVAGSGVWFGELPAASNIRIRGSYLMRDANWIGSIGDGVIRINGNEVVRLNPGSGPPFPILPFDTDISQFQGEDVLIELIADGERLSPDVADWIAPEIVVTP